MPYRDHKGPTLFSAGPYCVASGVVFIGVNPKPEFHRPASLASEMLPERVRQDGAHISTEPSCHTRIRTLVGHIRQDGEFRVEGDESLVIFSYLCDMTEREYISASRISFLGRCLQLVKK